MPYSYDDVINLLKTDEEINFIAYLRTSWHANGVKTALLKLSQTEKLKGIILLSSDDYKSDKPLVRKEDFASLGENIRFVVDYKEEFIYPKSKKELLKIKTAPVKYFAKHSKGSRKIYILNPMIFEALLVPRLKAALPQANIINVVTDEGLGVYMRSDFNWAIERYQNTKSIKRFFQTFIMALKKRYYKARAKKANEYINCEILKKDKKSYVENREIVEFCKKALNDDKVNPDEYRIYEKAVIISAQLYFENNQIKNDSDLSLYKYIVSRMKDKNITVIFKPHPRDKDITRYDCLGCYVEKDNTVSQESIIASLKVKPLAVLSFTSTSLVTTKLFYSVDAFSLINLVSRADLQPSLQNEFKNFEKTFSDVISIPHTIEELTEKIYDLNKEVE